MDNLLITLGQPSKSPSDNKNTAGKPSRPLTPPSLRSFLKNREIYPNLFLLKTLHLHTKPLLKIVFALLSIGQQYLHILQNLEPICEKLCLWWIISRKTLGMYKQKACQSKGIFLFKTENFCFNNRCERL